MCVELQSFFKILSCSLDVSPDKVDPVSPELFDPGDLAPDLPGVVLGGVVSRVKDVLPLWPLQHQLRVDVGRKEVGDVVDLGQVIAIVPVKHSLPDSLLVLVTQPIVAAVQLRVGFDQVRPKLIFGV